jgi:hypothetical protein
MTPLPPVTFPDRPPSLMEVKEDRDAFVARISRRRRRMRPIALLMRLLPGGAPQAASYDTSFGSDREALMYHYALRNDRLPDLDHPTDLNEKIRWQFINHPNPLMTLAADKIAVRAYLTYKGARIVAPPLLAQGSDPEELRAFDPPERFVLKSSYGSGQCHIETGAADPSGEKPPSVVRERLVALAREWRKWDQWRATGEFHYRPIAKRWLVEEYLPGVSRRLEYKIFCLHGEPVFLAVITERNRAGRPGIAGIRLVFFDPDWNRLALGMRGVAEDPRPVPRPPELDLLLAEARLLSEDFMHVRVDYLHFDDRPTFSELTFANLAARIPFEPLEWNRELGARMDLSRASEYLARGRAIANALGSPFRDVPEGAGFPLPKEERS